MNTTENNKIIAEFMGHHLEHPLIDTYNPSSEEYKYNTSWDWLMEVVEKIESLGYNVEILKNHCVIIADIEKTDSKRVTKYSESKIQAVYNACVEFIKWYNENK